jgi:hypothetical protein
MPPDDVRVQRFWVQRSGLYQDRLRVSGFNIQGYSGPSELLNISTFEPLNPEPLNPYP